VKQVVKSHPRSCIIIEISAEVARIDKRGRVRDKRIVKKQLTTRNFSRFLGRIVNVVDMNWDGVVYWAGYGRNLNRSETTDSMLYVGYGLGHAILAFGTSDVAPSRGDYILGAEVAYFGAMSGGEVKKTDTETEFSYGGMYTWTEGGTVREIGLYYNMKLEGIAPGVARTLIDRAVLPTPLTVPAGESITITYRVRTRIT